VQHWLVNRVRAGRQQLSAKSSVCRRSPGRHLRRQMTQFFVFYRSNQRRFNIFSPPTRSCRPCIRSKIGNCGISIALPALSV